MGDHVMYSDDPEVEMEEVDPSDVYVEGEFEEDLAEIGEVTPPGVKGIRIIGAHSAPAHMIPPKAVHQCNVCNKIFVSFKGIACWKKNRLAKKTILFKARYV